MFPMEFWRIPARASAAPTWPLVTVSQVLNATQSVSRTTDVMVRWMSQSLPRTKPRSRP